MSCGTIYVLIDYSMRESFNPKFCEKMRFLFFRIKNFCYICAVFKKNVMEYKNKTEQNVYDQIVNSDLRVCQKVKDVMLLSFQKTKYGNYAVFYNDICLGMFMSKDFVDPNELKECGWIIKPGIFGANVIKG